MKYIKTFEFENIDSISLLKKYCIWKNISNDTLEILELISKKEGEKNSIKYIEYMSIELYKYYKSINKLVKITDQDPIPFDSFIIEKYIPYTSDNLQDCIDMLPLITSVEKYNI